MELLNLMRFCYNNRTNNFTKRNKNIAFKDFSSNHFGVQVIYILIVPKLDRVKVIFSIFCIGNLSLSKYSRCCQCPLCMSSALLISTHEHWCFSASRTWHFDWWFSLAIGAGLRLQGRPGVTEVNAYSLALAQCRTGIGG